MTAVLHGDCLAILPTLPPDSFDSCVTDPPYHLVSIVKRFGAENAKPAISTVQRRFAKTGAAMSLGPDGQPTPDQYGRLSKGFMGKQWDGGDVAARPETWAEIYRVLKPGAHLVAFGGTRTYHRMACAIEDAGFEIRDCIQWIYGSGFPKSHDVSKGIDRAAGAEREVVGRRKHPTLTDESKIDAWPATAAHGDNSFACEWDVTAPATDAARQWQGWGTALKPACEPIVLARKPLSEGTVAANVLRWGTGAINVDGCRVDGEPWTAHIATGLAKNKFFTDGEAPKIAKSPHDLGRWPANVVHDGSDEVVQGFPDSAAGTDNGERGTGGIWQPSSGVPCGPQYGDTGSAARFFYQAKADSDNRIGSRHPTVKPVDLMQWLVRLVTPKGGAVLDPFAGTGTTGEAAWREGCHATLIEREVEYLADIARRMELMKAGPDERAREIIKASGKAQGHEDLPLFDRAWADMWEKPFDRPELVWGKK